LQKSAGQAPDKAISLLGTKNSRRGPRLESMETRGLNSRPKRARNGNGVAEEVPPSSPSSKVILVIFIETAWPVTPSRSFFIYMAYLAAKLTFNLMLETG